MDMKIVVMDGDASSWEEAIHLCAEKLHAQGYVKKDFEENCIRREKQFPTGLNTELPIAIPHTESEYVCQSAICFLRLKQPVNFMNMENAREYVPARYVLNLAIREKEKQVPVLARVIEVFQNGNVLKQMSSLDLDEFRRELVEKLAMDG